MQTRHNPVGAIFGDTLVAAALRRCRYPRATPLRIALFILILLVVLLLYAATKPSSIRVQRSITINAPPDKVFVLINDFHNWSNWAPQNKQDATMTRTFGGPPSGVGAISEWTSTGSAGQGRMSITESVPNRRVQIQVDFRKPFETHNTNIFELEPAGNSTTVTWTLETTNRYFIKLLTVFLSMEQMFGRHFEIGLRNLKSAAEE
jgi:uncharacterized protein YndB with AHSA1/START domain